MGHDMIIAGLRNFVVVLPIRLDRARHNRSNAMAMIASVEIIKLQARSLKVCRRSCTPVEGAISTLFVRFEDHLVKLFHFRVELSHGRNFE